MAYKFSKDPFHWDWEFTERSHLEEAGRRISTMSFNLRSFNLRNPNRIVRAGIVVLNSETELLDIAPIDLLNGLTKSFVRTLHFPDEMIAEAFDITFHWINEHGGDIRLTSGAVVKATDSFTTCPPLDIVIMGAHHDGYVPNAAEQSFIHKAYKDCSAFLAICGGFMPLMQTGLLANKAATAPRSMVDKLREEHPEVAWVERRWCVGDGKLWTSGTLLNELDCMRAFALKTWGGRPAGLVEALLEIGAWPNRGEEYETGQV